MTAPHARTGILLINLGTPDAPTAAATRRYLAEFLSDQRVVEAPRAVWLPVLHGVILRLRPRRSAANYAKIWSEEGSPLLAISRRQAAAVRAALSTRLGHELPVALGMRYGKPSIESALDELTAAGATRIVALPLYPQYSASTSATAFDAIAAVFRRRREIPSLSFVRDYHDDAGYIRALANSIREAWAEHGRGDKLLLSFHGVPKAFVEKGDPYAAQCHATGRLLATELELGEDDYQVTFQSRFGPTEWLQPYTDKTLEALARDGVKRVDLACPGFSADCLETLEENAMTNRELYLAAGGEQLRYIPCLNDRHDHIEALVELIVRNLPA